MTKNKSLNISLPRKAYYPNMDLMRYLLALAVVVGHINYLTGSRIPFVISSVDAVGGFFALSGFLMYPNYMRHRNVLKYAIQRARRIIPPYVFIVLVAAIGLCAVSSLSMSEYYFSGGFWKYLAANLSFLNWLHPSLPGVFGGSRFVDSAVNGSLWTMKVEWCLYFSLPIFVWILSKLHRLDLRWASSGVILISIAYRLLFTHLFNVTGNDLYGILARQVFGQLAYFYCGMFIYFIKDKFCNRLLSWVILGLILYILSGFGDVFHILLNPFAMTILVMAGSLIPRDIAILRHRNNVSYEIYLFHWPVIQLSVWMGISCCAVWVEATFVICFTVVLSLIAHPLCRRLWQR